MKGVNKLIIPTLFIILLIIGFLLRSRTFLNGDFYYLLDQSRDLLLTKSIVIDHKMTLIGARSGLGGLFHGASWIYMIVPFFFLAKGNPFWTLVPLFEVINLGIIAVGFFVGARLYNKWIGLLIAFFLTISQPLVQTVPYTSNAQVLPIVFLLYLYAMVQWMRKKEKHFILALFAIGLGFQFESAFAILLIPLTAFAILLSKRLPTIKNFALGIVAFLIGVSTFILFDLRHHFLMTTSFVKLFTNPVKPLPGYEQYASLGFRLHDRLANLWSSVFTPLFNTDKLSEFLLLCIIILGIYFFIKNSVLDRKVNEVNKEYLFFLLSPLIIFGTYVAYPLPLWPHYLLPIAVLASVILAVSIREAWYYKPAKICISLFLLISFYPVCLWIGQNYISRQTYVPQSDGSYRNQLTVAQWLMQDAQNKDYGYFVYTPGILTYNMDYLLWWQSVTNHLPTPSNTKRPITYLILYPHLANDQHAYDFWKEQVVRTKGKVVTTKYFQSGIMVQKLQISKQEPPADPNYYQSLIFR